MKSVFQTVCSLLAIGVVFEVSAYSGYFNRRGEVFGTGWNSNYKTASAEGRTWTYYSTKTGNKPEMCVLTGVVGSSGGPKTSLSQTATGQVIVPAVCYGYTVVSAEGSFMSGCTGVTEVIVREGVPAIGGIRGCTSLTNVVAKGVDTLWDNAFLNDTKLETISFSAAMHEIGYDAFKNCQAIRAVTFPGPVPTGLSRSQLSSNAWVNCAADYRDLWYETGYKIVVCEIALEPAESIKLRECIASELDGIDEVVVNVGPYEIDKIVNKIARPVVTKEGSTLYISNILPYSLDVDKVVQRYPWNGKVDLDFEIHGDEYSKFKIDVFGIDCDGGTNLPVKTIHGGTIFSAGKNRTTWDADADIQFDGEFTNLTLAVKCTENLYSDDVGLNGVFERTYIVVDLNDYSVTGMEDVPTGGWGNEYKTDKLVLRRISPGTFVMGAIFPCNIHFPFEVAGLREKSHPGIRG